jgi:hypothetical protein
MASPKSGIFSTFVFNNLAKIIPIFHPFFSDALGRQELINYLIFNEIDSWRIFAAHR